MLKFENVSFSYSETKIIDKFSLSANDGECICIVGKSGCGKTTVTRLICGLEVPDVGTISAPKKISCVFQEDRLIETLDVKTNIRLPLKKHQFTKADELISLFGLKGYEKTKVSKLSGGMKRRVSIIRALTFGGDLLILDEPFNGIDPENKRIIADKIKQDFNYKGKTVVMVSHVKQDAELLNARIVNM